MRRFRFNLEGVLDLRRQAEQEVRQHLAAALAHRSRLQDQLDAAIDAERSLNEYFRTNRLSVLQMQLQTTHGEHARQRIVDARVQLHHQDEEIGRIRERLVAAAAARTALERLREQRRDEHRRSAQAAEQAELDELAVLRHARASAGPLGAAGAAGVGVAA